ncbi:terpene synthase family protein [Saccharothrix syringae]|uniref:Uncharacterized protein n=1 Tax=Saccharothrix syringae TaxID=103733 RepID=A0A5Q0H115_SACSY|nr:terpene synthase family protein [Saccharothrix syringae]QFZ19956.1 hypothetical protein EKG83_23285 [Saccharothrix syringae]
MASPTAALTTPIPPGLLSFYCPFEPTTHPAVDTVERLALDWVDRAGFRPTPKEWARAVATRCAHFTCRVLPPSTDLDLLVAATCWVHWLFAFDDAYCDTSPMPSDPVTLTLVCHQAERAFEHPDWRFGSPFPEAMRDLGRRFRALADVSVVNRMGQALRTTLSGMQWQAAVDARGRRFDTSNYLVLRRRTGGAELVSHWLQLARDAPLPTEWLELPAVAALAEMAGTIGGLDNDRYSYAREVRRHEVHNLFAVIERERGCSPEEAVRAGVALRDRLVLRFLAVREQVLSWADPALARYVDDIGRTLAGTVEWGCLAARHLPEGVRPAYTDGPLDDDPAPLPYPSVAWWWDDDLLSPAAASPPPGTTGQQRIGEDPIATSSYQRVSAPSP